MERRELPEEKREQREELEARGRALLFAAAAANKLIQRGHEVLAICCETPRPVIVVGETPACDGLPHCLTRREQVPTGEGVELQTWCTSVFEGVQVEWERTGDFPIPATPDGETVH